MTTMHARRSMSLPSILAAVGAPAGSGLVARAAGWPWWLVIGAVVVALAVVILTQRRDLFAPFLENVVEPEIARPHDDTKRTRYTTLLWLLVGGSLIAVVLGAGQWGWAAFTLSLGGALVYQGAKVHVPRGRGRAAASIAVGGFLISLGANFIAGALAGETDLSRSITSVDGNVKQLLGLAKDIKGDTTQIKDDTAAMRAEQQKQSEQLALIQKHLESQKPPGMNPSSLPDAPDLLEAANALSKSKDARDRAQAAIVLEQWDAAKKEIDAFSTSPAEDELFRNKVIEGDFYLAQMRFDEAVAPYEIAFALRPAAYQARSGLAKSLQSCTLGNYAEKVRRAIEMHRAILADSRITHSQRVDTQGFLSLALRNLGRVSDGAERTSLLSESVALFRVWAGVSPSSEEERPLWAFRQGFLAECLRDLALVSSGNEQASVLGESAEAYRASLGFFRRDEVPFYWASQLNNLGLVLAAQALASKGEEQSHLFSEAIAAHRSALEVFTREESPQDWALTQNNLGAVLSDQAMGSEGQDRARLLAEAEAAYHEALKVRTREALPLSWAMTQNNLGIVLSKQALTCREAECCRLVKSAVSAFHGALLIYTNERFPTEHTTTLNYLEDLRSLYESSGCAAAPGGVPFDDIPPAE